MAVDFLSSHWNFTGVDKLYYEFENIYVETKTGFVFNEKAEPIFKLYYESLFWGPAIPAINFQFPALLHEALCKKYVKVDKHSEELKELLVEKKEITSLDEAIYLLHPFGWYAYGHLHDSLLRLFSMPEKMSSAKLLCCDYRRVVKFDQHIEALGYRSEQIIDQRDLPRFIKVKKLHYPVNPGVPTNYTPDSYTWMRKQYLQYFTKDENLEPIKGIYLSRNSVKSGARGVLNEADVIKMLQLAGFTILDGTQNLGEVVSLFLRAEKIIGPHGSLFVNTIFSNENAKIYEFCPKNRPDHSFKNKFKACKHYEHFLVDADEKHNININLNQLEDIING
jgi:capsular polysaccharide biosynthesis protein